MILPPPGRRPIRVRTGPGRANGLPGRLAGPTRGPADHPGAREEVRRMARVAMAHMTEAPAALSALDSGARPNGSVRSRAVIGGEERPLWLFVHELDAGARV